MTEKKTDLNALRKTAEALLADTSYEGKDFSGLNVRELLHELHIHQAELEVQNEELQEARDELEAERNRYLDLFESAPVGYAVLDEKGTIRDANLVMAEMLGIDRRLLTGRQFSRFVAPRFRSRCYTHFQALKEARIRQTNELEMQGPGGDPLPVRLDSIPVPKDGGEIQWIRTAVSDLSVRKAAEAGREEALAEAAHQRDRSYRLLERFRMVAEATNSAIFICDLERFRFVNSAAVHLTGLDRERLMAIRPWRVLKPSERATAEAHLKEAIQQNNAGRTCTLTLLTAGGEERQVEVTINQVLDEGREAVLGTAVDITDHKRLETELRERLDARTRELTDALRKLEEEVAEARASDPSTAEKNEEADALNQKIGHLNTALEVLLQKRQSDRREIEDNITASVRQVIMPEIETLKAHSTDPEIRRCLGLLEMELDQMTSSFACTLTGRYNLSSTEIRVAQLIKEGLTTDEISDHLNLAAKTISFHRNNIRKKLGIHKKKVNLQTHLLSFS